LAAPGFFRGRHIKLLSKGLYFESNLVWRRFIVARKFLKNLGFPVFQKLWRKAFNPD
jgi:hypothetical protein